MKIVTWNCKMKFREDSEKILPLKPDILIVPECENFNLSDQSDSHWIGDNPSKGLGVFTFNDYKIELYKDYTDEYKYILPLVVSRQNESYHVMGIWTQKVEKRNKDHQNYIRQFQLSLNHYDSFLDHDNVIVCGDFNSNLIWKRTGVDNDHQEVLDYLSDKNIHSSYHHFYKEEQGKESIPTYYHYHQKERPFHIDFCFLSQPLMKTLHNVELGKFDEWMKLSDHVPMIVEY